MQVELVFDPVPEGWVHTTLGEACELGGGNIQTGPFGSQLHASDYVAVGIPSIMPKDLGDNRVIEDEIARISSADAQRLNRYLVQDGDIVYSRRGDVEKRALIRKHEEGWLCGTGCLRIRFGEKGVDPQYATYFLAHPSVREWISRHAHGATMPNLNTAILASCPFLVPPLPEQRAIAHILGTLDDKIELNRRMNETLEAMARVLFRSWFVDFDPVRAKMEGRWRRGQSLPGLPTHLYDLFPDRLVPSELGEIPEGWEFRRGDEVADIGIGKTPPRKQPRWFSSNDNDLSWISIRDLGNCSAYINETSEYLTEGAVERFRVRRIPNNTVVLSFKLTIGRVAITDGEMLSNEAIAHFKLGPAATLSPEYLYCYLVNFRYEGLGSTSSIARAINSKIVKAMPILVPGVGAVASFQSAVGQKFRRMKALAHEGRTLAALRDTLLPKLLGGVLSLGGSRA